ncbi:IS6 family transposase [Psychromonas sp. RZ22]|uniref:DDE-type integrase/transposase/recombinase n=1 Tax=Psychromonas algarum TaxID=2555643 RepID=UPI001067B337|nr:DDE-type integrase/transposase/recombinase [Psychromonas sp. RZ22]TEW54305.1 IS6 family transposase [Psychromonas sp. RZ22]
MRFFKRLLKGQGVMPLKIVTDKLASYSAAKKELMPSIDHSTVQYENNRCELSLQPTRQVSTTYINSATEATNSLSTVNRM